MICNYKYLYFTNTIMLNSGGIIIKSAFWIAIALILSTLCSACISNNQEESTELTQGTPQVIEEAPEEVSQSYSLQDAISALQWFEENVSTSSLMIHTVHGSSINIEGKAIEWIFGVEIKEDPYILIFSKGEWTKYRWGERFDTAPIGIDEIISPENLYDTNRAAIMEIMNRTGTDTTSLDIIDDKVIIASISEGRVVQLILNAYTGEVIVSDV